jgi:hypothetical protein
MTLALAEIIDPLEIGLVALMVAWSLLTDFYAN